MSETEEQELVDQYEFELTGPTSDWHVLAVHMQEFVRFIRGEKGILSQYFDTDILECRIALRSWRAENPKEFNKWARYLGLKPSYMRMTLTELVEANKLGKGR